MKIWKGNGSLVLAALLTAAVGHVCPPPAQAQRGGGQIEGIEVHGRWVIEVRDPDGTLVTRRAFDNDLTVPGQEFLSRVLARQATARYWSITLNNNPWDPQPCLRSDGSEAACQIVEDEHPLSQYPPANVFTGLSAQVTDNNEFILRGSATAMAEGAVAYVMTLVWSVTSGLDIEHSFTTGYLPQALAVQAGQSISVTVTFSFS